MRHKNKRLLQEGLAPRLPPHHRTAWGLYGNGEFYTDPGYTTHIWASPQLHPLLYVRENPLKMDEWGRGPSLGVIGPPDCSWGKSLSQERGSWSSMGPSC